MSEIALPLSKTLDPADLTGPLADVADHVRATIAAVTSDPTVRDQHPMRVWEYSMALAALQTWGRQAVDAGQDPGDPFIYDVGGAGSPFHYTVPYTVRVIDPDHAEAPYTLEAYLQEHLRLASCVFCLSVLEHVDDLDQFLYHLGCLVAPGGLLFLTFDACGCVGAAWRERHVVPADPHHFHWMRKRIFTPEMTAALANTVVLQHHFHLLGERDAVWHGAQVYDYTFASLALVKRS